MKNVHSTVVESYDRLGDQSEVLQFINKKKCEIRTNGATQTALRRIVAFLSFLQGYKRTNFYILNSDLIGIILYWTTTSYFYIDAIVIWSYYVI